MNVEIKVITNAKKREIVGFGPELKVKLTALPRDGRANDELIRFLADIFHIRKGDMKIVRGEKEHRKVIFLPVDEKTFKAVLEERARTIRG